MSDPKFPKSRKLMESELEAWAFLFEKIGDFEKRIKILEGKLSHLREETELGIE